MNKMIRRLDRIKQKQLKELKRIMQNQTGGELEKNIEKEIKYFDWNYEANKR